MEAGPPSPTPEREPLSLADIRDVWALLTPSDRIQAFLLLPRDDAEDFFFSIAAHDQAEVVLGMPAREQRSWVRLLPPDDAADLIQAAPPEKRDALLALLDEPTRREVTALLAYSEDNAGGLMNPRYIRLRPEMTVDEAISYVRKQMREQPRTIYYGYVLDGEQRLLGVVSFRELFTATVRTRVAEIMTRQVTTIPEQMDQEVVSLKFGQSHLVALPVVDVDGHMKGIVTVDDVVDVVREEATEDMQKVGGVEALEREHDRLALAQALDDCGVEQLARPRLDLLLGDASAQQRAHLREREHGAALLHDALGEAPGLGGVGRDDQQQAARRVAQAVGWGEHATAGGDVDRARRRIALAGRTVGGPATTLVGADLDAAHGGSARHRFIIPYRTARRIAIVAIVDCMPAIGAVRWT